MPEVSAVIIVMTDAEKDYAAKSIASVAAQTAPVEIVVVYNRDLPWMQEIATDYAKKMNVIFHPSPKLYAAQARNLGTRLANGSVVCFLDGDDFWMPEKVSCQIAAFTSESTQVMGCDHVMVDSEDLPFSYGLCQNLPMTSGWMVRRSFMLEHPFDESLKKDEDAEWWIRCFAQASPKRLPAVLIRYTVRRNSLSSATATKKRKELIMRSTRFFWMRWIMLSATSVARRLRMRDYYTPLKQWYESSH